MPARRIRSLFNPVQFQGWGKKRSYFEGWYFKLLSRDETAALAIIPGIAMDERGNRHAFIQVLDGRERTARYHRFEYDSFIASRDRFLVSIDNNHFSEDSVTLDLPELKGRLCFSGNVPWPGTWRGPGIMGPYTFVPFMECYHGIVSMDHTISGTLQLNGRKYDFSGGKGYTEKDWGRSFPEGYIWLQSNHFDEPGISIKTSVAKIPWLGSSFVGFISGLWLKDHLIRFTTYNGSALRKVGVSADSAEIIMENRKYRLVITVVRDKATSLASPVRGHMEGRIEESMSSVIDIDLTDMRSGRSVFSGRGRNAAVEVAGKVEEIISD